MILFLDDPDAVAEGRAGDGYQGRQCGVERSESAR